MGSCKRRRERKEKEKGKEKGKEKKPAARAAGFLMGGKIMLDKKRLLL